MLPFNTRHPNNTPNCEQRTVMELKINIKIAEKRKQKTNNTTFSSRETDRETERENENYLVPQKSQSAFLV